jgi:hypothetical protein
MREPSLGFAISQLWALGLEQQQVFIRVCDFSAPWALGLEQHHSLLLTLALFLQVKAQEFGRVSAERATEDLGDSRGQGHTSSVRV